jgi:hypothetical protein
MKKCHRDETFHVDYENFGGGAHSHLCGDANKGRRPVNANDEN